jgi:hypothetical protein
VTTSPILAKTDIGQRFLSILSYAILVGGIVTISVVAHMVVVSYSSLPYVDGWAEIDAVSRGANLSLPGWLWKQHNEHRLVIPKLFLLVDLRLFRATQVFLLASVFVVQLLHLALLGWSMRVLGSWRGDLWRTGVGLAAFCLFCPSQWFNFVLGFQVNFVLLGLFVTLSFVGLLLYWIRSQEPSGSQHAARWLLLSILGALSASYTLANGNLLWPLLVAAAVLLGFRHSALISLALAGAISTAFYFHDYVSPMVQANATSVKSVPASFFKFAAAYLGSPWVRANQLSAAIIGIVGAGAACLFVLPFRSYVRTRKAFSVQLVLLLLFCIGTSFVTALGRLNFGTSYALSPRYQTFALLFWCCLGLLLLETAGANQFKRLPLVVMQICLLAIMLRAAYLAKYPIKEARSHGFQLNAASMALLTGVHDWEQLSYTGVKLSYLMNEAPYLQQGRLSIYSGYVYSQLGKPLVSVFRLAYPDECTGGLESSENIGEVSNGPPALRITGWAWDYKHRRPPTSIMATTGGIITGLGAMGDWRPLDKTTRPEVTANYIGYTGYVQGARAAGPVEIYTVLDSSPATACLIATVK